MSESASEASASRTRPARSLNWFRQVLPGLVLAILVATLAVLTARWLPPTVGPILVAVIAGLLLANVFTLPSRTKPGLKFASKRVLRLGIILLGARLTLTEVASIGGRSFGVIAICMIFAFSCVVLLSRLAGVQRRLGTLIAVGTAVCGNSAIMATAPVLDCKDREVSFAIGTITIFGTSALLLFPVIAHLVDLPDAVVGLWFGLAINDTSQVVAAGAAHSPAALEIATVVKLVRNALMAPLILLIAWWTVRQVSRTSDSRSRSARTSATGAFPLFVLGFLLLVVLRSTGLISEDVASVMSSAANLLIVIAIAAVGLGTRMDDLRQVGIKPFVVGFGASVSLAVVALALATWVSGSY